MSLESIVVLIVTLYLLIGAIAAYANFRIVKHRGETIESMNQLRREAFQKGISYGIELGENVRQIGIDEDFALQASPTLRDPLGASFLTGDIQPIIAIAITLFGPFYYVLLWKDYWALKELKKAYQCLLSLQEKLLQSE